MLSLRHLLILCGCIVFSFSATMNVEADQVRQPPAASQIDDHADQSTTTHRFSIQVGAFKQMQAAEEALSLFSQKGSEPYYVHEPAGNKGMWYRLYVGRYLTKQAALDAARQLKRRGVIESYMIRKMERKTDTPSAVDPQQMNDPPSDVEKMAKQQPDPAEPSGLADQSNPIWRENYLWTAGLKTDGSFAQARASHMFDTAGVEDRGHFRVPVRLSLQDAIHFSLQGNREITVVSYSPKQALANVDGAQSVYDPLFFADATFRRDPNLQSSVTDIATDDKRIAQAGIKKPLKTGGSLSTYLESRYENINNAAFDRSYKYIFAPTVELRQPLLNNVGGKKEQAAIKIANYQAAISQEDFRQKVLEVTNNVAKVYWKLFLAKTFIAINQQNLSMAEEVYRREDVRLLKGISQQLDVERSRSNVQSRRSALLKSKEQYRVAMDRLKLLLNGSRLNIDSKVDVIPVDAPNHVAVKVDEPQAIETALTNRPEIAKARQVLKIQEVGEDLSRHQRLPKLDALGRYSLSGYGDTFQRAGEDMSFNDDDAWEVGVYFEYPLGNRSADSLHRKKTLKRMQANAQLERLEDDVKLDVKQVLHGMMTAEGEIEATRLAMEAAEKVVEGEFARFDIGQTSNLELLRAQDLLAMANRSYCRAVVDYNIALNDLVRAQGMLPEGIAIEDVGR